MKMKNNTPYAYYNEDQPSDIVSLYPQGTNSTMFTACCHVAICSDQPNCPRCERPVVGHDTENLHEREKIRWKNATQHWNREKYK